MNANGAASVLNAWRSRPLPMSSRTACSGLSPYPSLSTPGSAWR